MRFSANFQDFFKIQKIRNLKLIVSQLFGVSQSSQRSYLLVKLHFWCFLDTQNSCYLKVQKTAKMRFYKQVWSVWWSRYSKKLTCNKFEVSDFLKFEKILKIRWKTQKRVIFTKMLFSQRRVKTLLFRGVWHRRTANFRVCLQMEKQSESRSKTYAPNFRSWVTIKIVF